MKLTYKDVPFSIDGNILEDSFTPREYNMIIYSLRLFKNVQHILTIKSSKTSTVKSMAYQMINKAIPDFIYDICNYHTEGYFYESTYGTHHQIAWNHNITDDDGAFYFAYAISPLTQELTDLVKKGFYEPTEKQKEWLHTHMCQLSVKQQQMVDKILKGC